MSRLIIQALLVSILAVWAEGAQTSVPLIVDYSILNSYRLKETTPIETILGNVTAYDPDGGDVEFFLTGNGAQYLSIDQKSGVVKTIARLDFETLSQIDARLRVVDDEGQISDEDCLIIVLDENDELPEYRYPAINKELNESAAIGTFIHDVEVTDIDTKNSIIELECDDSTDDKKDACETFELRREAHSNLDWRGALYLKKKLDYEQRKGYVYVVIANDGLNIRTNEIHMEVVDVNDTPPKWTRPEPVTINEELATGTVITSVTAKDGDETDSRAIYYELIEEHTDVFSIDGDTGEISIAQRLDFDAANSRKDKPFVVTIMAREVVQLEGGGTEFGNDAATTATTALEITMEDINDNAPEFVENGRNKTSYTVYIDEDISTGQNIPGLLMTVTDRDQTEIFNTFRLDTDKFKDIFQIIPNEDSASTSPSIFVVDSQKIDYEKGDKEYIIEVTAVESKVSNPKTGSTTVTIIVRDVNDQTPEFRKKEYTMAISEESPNNFPVLKVEADDDEEGENGKAGIRYELFGNIPEHFSLNDKTGQLTVVPCAGSDKHGKSPCIDFEKKKKYFLKVSATDNNGKNGLTRSVPVTIDILDENDNAPSMEDSYTRYIYELQTVTINPLIIEAKDPDTKGQVVFEIRDDPGNYWKIEEGTRNGNRYANITAQSKILYSNAPNQATGEFKFVVFATDQKYSDIARVTIIVLDVNNNEPYFVSSLYRETVPETTTAQTLLTRVTAKDDDSPTTDNGIIDFAIISGGAGKFFMNDTRQEANGEFTVAIYTVQDAGFDYSKENQYRMILECRDRGTPDSKTGTTVFIVDVTDANNVAPIIRPTSATINVREDTAVGTSVHKIEAEDPDVDKDLRYYMFPESGIQPTGADAVGFENLFIVEETTGIVRVNGPLNRDDVAFITNELEVRDIGSAIGNQIGTGVLFIRITEFNDQDPVFQTDPYNITLDEEKTRNSFVASLECTDADDRIAGYTLEQIAPRRFPRYLTLLPDTGTVIINDRIDFEDIEYIELIATCGDNGQPSRSATTQFYVNVRNINDNTPNFQQTSYTGSIAEGTVPVETFLTQVSARDIDKGDYGVVKYRLEADAETFFRIDGDNGRIFVKQGAVFDRERNRNYDFQVYAYDSPLDASVRRNSTAPVYITITDINDNCPVFAQPSYSRAVPESFGALATILDVVATDDDLGINAQLEYAIQPGSGQPAGVENYFEIITNANYGRLRTRLPLRDQVGFMDFNVTVEDKGANSCTATVPVTIEVKESQNDAPEWIRPPQRDWVIEVLESQYRGMLVYDSKAVDVNEGPNGVVDYFFIHGNKLTANTPEFRINKITGIIRAEVVFDREQVDRYFLTLVARDKGNPPASSETTMTVVILDVDDNDPRFPVKDGGVEPLVLTWEEDKVPSPSVPLGNCSYLATDDDSDHDNNKIYYRLLTTNRLIQDHIRVDRETCQIFLKKAPENDVDLEFDILAFNDKNDDTVVRYKRAVNPSILPVVINVEGVDDIAPVFSQTEYLACAPMDAAYRQTLLQVTATDADSSALSYSVPPTTTSLGMDARLGTLYNLVSFRSGARIYSTPVIVRDPSGNNDTSQATVFITDPENLAKLEISRSWKEVDPFKDLYVSTIKANSDGEIDFACIASIEAHQDDDGDEDDDLADMYLMAAKKADDGTYTILPAEQTVGLVDGMIAGDNNQLGDLYVTDVEASGDDDDWDLDEDEVLAIFIICLLLIVLAIILIILACYCIRKSKQKKVKKLRAERHTIVTVGNEPVSASSNPVYYVGPDDSGTEYATVQKKPVQPMQPVVIPAPQSLEPVPSPAPTNLQPAQEPEEPEPYIETEVLPGPPSEVPPTRLQNPEYEDPIETTVVEDEPQAPEPVQVPEPVAIQEPEPARPATPPASEPDVPSATGEDEIEVEIRDSPPASAPASPPASPKDSPKGSPAPSKKSAKSDD